MSGKSSSPKIRKCFCMYRYEGYIKGGWKKLF